jgi:hypothetical protein
MAPYVPCLLHVARKRIPADSVHAIWSSLRKYHKPPTLVDCRTKRMRSPPLATMNCFSSSSNPTSSTVCDPSMQLPISTISIENLLQESTLNDATSTITSQQSIALPDERTVCAQSESSSEPTESTSPDVSTTTKNESPALTDVHEYPKDTRKPRAANPTRFSTNKFYEPKAAKLDQKIKPSKKKFKGHVPYHVEDSSLYQNMTQPPHNRAYPLSINPIEIVDRLLNRYKKSSGQSNAMSLSESLSHFSSIKKSRTLGEHLFVQGEKTIPTSTWVFVEGISPVSGLESMLAGIQNALDAEESKGIVDLDKSWSEGEPIPVLDTKKLVTMEATTTDAVDGIATSSTATNNSSHPDKWVRKAKVVLSPFARPTGWYLQFDNRSVVYALLRHAKESPVRFSWREVRIQEYVNNVDSKISDPISRGNFLLHEKISNHTLRVENCPYHVTQASLLNFFSRYDLQVGAKAVERWQGETTNGVICPPTTYLVHFADTSWARAALREKQNSFMYKMGQPVKDFKNPKPLHLAQYPRQIL